MTRTTVLVVEDDAAIRRGLVDALSFAGYEVLECDNGRAALELALETTVDLVLLDVMLPGMDGFEVLRELRTTNTTVPTIMVTARGSERDRVRGLQDGADDYVVKPFSARELLARVEAVLRRSPERAESACRLRCAPCAIDLQRREVVGPDGVTRHLTELEAALLRYLAGRPGRAVDRDELIQRVWGLNPRGLRTRTVDMHIARLREKIEPDPTNPRIILTVRNKGYMLGGSVQVDTT